MTDPEMLLLDEPAASLDVGAREELVGLLGGYASSKTSPVIVMVTHHVEEIPNGFSHALLLSKGKVFASGPIEQVLNSENLSNAFGVPLSVTRDGNRFNARGSEN
jgi:iron complex transport system ATP-binding protein